MYDSDYKELTSSDICKFAFIWGDATLVTFSTMSNQFEHIAAKSRETPCSDICKFAFIWAAASFPGGCNSE